MLRMIWFWHSCLGTATLPFTINVPAETFTLYNHLRNRGHFERERVGTPLPTLKCFKNALWTQLRTIFWQICTRLHDFAYTNPTFFSGSISGHPQERPRCLDPYTNFRLARQRSHCYCFTKQSLVPNNVLYAKWQIAQRLQQDYATVCQQKTNLYVYS